MQHRFVAAATTAGSLATRQRNVASMLQQPQPINIATVKASNRQNSIIYRVLLVSCSLPFIGCKFLVSLLVTSSSIVKLQELEREQTGVQQGVPHQETERFQW